MIIDEVNIFERDNVEDLNSGDKEGMKLGIGEKSEDNIRVGCKVTNTYIINIVHNYFCIFHSWLPTNKYEKILLKLISYSAWSTLILIIFLVFINHEFFNQLVGCFISFDFSIFWILALASFLILLILLFTGYWYLAPRKIEVLQNRMKSELNIDTSNLSNLKKKIIMLLNLRLKSYGLKKYWIIQKIFSI